MDLEKGLNRTINRTNNNNKPYFITLIINIDSLKLYKPQIYREAVSKRNIKQWEKLMENKVNFLTKNYT